MPWCALQRLLGAPGDPGQEGARRTDRPLLDPDLYPVVCALGPWRRFCYSQRSSLSDEASARTVNGVMLAAVTGTLRRYLQDRLVAEHQGADARRGAAVRAHRIGTRGMGFPLVRPHIKPVCRGLTWLAMRMLEAWSLLVRRPWPKNWARGHGRPTVQQPIL